MPLQPYFLPATLALLLSLYLYSRSPRADGASSAPPDGDVKRRPSQDVPGMARDADGTFTCTAASVHAARAVLMARGLPPELADMVLQRAEYWPAERAETDRLLTVAPRPSLAAPHTVDPAACLYLQTGPLGLGRAASSSGLADEPRARCRRVVFRIVAKDQGWASGGEARPGEYRGAFSWFEASVARADERRPSQELLNPLVTLMAGPFGTEHGNQNLVNWANFYHTTEPRVEAQALARGGWRFVERDGEVAWLVQRNKIAHQEFLEHTVEWRDDDGLEEDDDDNDDASLEDDDGDNDDAWPEDGKGKGRGFVAALERGDRILVWARAMVRRDSVFGLQ
jgi:hypothetical protein